MDCTTLALKLIKNYNDEFNRMKRARYQKNKIVFNTEYQVEMGQHGLRYCLYSLPQKMRSFDCRQARDYFQNSNIEKRHAFVAFVSAAVKRRELRKIKQHIDAMRAIAQTPVTVAQLEREYKELEAAPVLVKLGAMWRKYVDAVIEENRAYDARWRARCAIYAFNTMGTGIKIKFGNCSSKGGSMSYIRYVVIDGDKIPLRKFLDNAEFESAVLNA